MIRPDIKTFHNDWRDKWLSPDIRRRHFLGRGALEMYRQCKKKVDVNLKKVDQRIKLEITMP